MDRITKINSQLILQRWIISQLNLGGGGGEPVSEVPESTQGVNLRELVRNSPICTFWVLIFCVSYVHMSIFVIVTFGELYIPSKGGIRDPPIISESVHER